MTEQEAMSQLFGSLTVDEKTTVFFFCFRQIHSTVSLADNKLVYCIVQHFSVLWEVMFLRSTKLFATCDVDFSFHIT